MKNKDINAEEINGMYILSTIANNQRIKQKYIFTPLKEAKRSFKLYVIVQSNK